MTTARTFLGVTRACIGIGAWIAPDLTTRAFGMDPAQSNRFIGRLFGARELALALALLADEDHAVAEEYGVWAEKSMYGRTYWGVVRSTFVIDGEGVVRHVIPKVTPKTHDEQVLAALEDLAG